MIDLGAAGHVNEKCGYGPWLDGHELVERLLRGKSDPVSVDRPRKDSGNDHGSTGLNVNVELSSHGDACRVIPPTR